jgi:hypothetical protein
VTPEGQRTEERPAPAQLAPLLVGIVALLVAAVTLFFDAGAFFRGYLYGWVLWVGPALGGAGLLMMHHLSGGRWGWPVRRPLSGAALTLPLIVLLFVPLLFGVSWLYPWAREPAHAEGSSLVPFREVYLQRWFFYLRTAVYLLIWAVGGWLAWLASRGRRVHAPKLAAAGLVIYVLSATFAFYDWVATLQPHWYSSIYGLYTIIGQVAAALCLTILAASVVPGVVGRPIETERRHELGNLLLVVVVLWAYLAFSQYFIIWNGNLPHEIEWYLPRLRGGWGGVAVALIAVHFLLPFAALLFRATKRRRSSLLAVAMLVLVAHVTEVAWRVLPSFEEPGVWTAVSAAASTIGIGGCMIAGFGRALGWTGMPETEEEPA